MNEYFNRWSIWTIQEEILFLAKEDKDGRDRFFFSVIIWQFVGYSLCIIQNCRTIQFKPMLYIRTMLEQPYFSLSTENNNSYLIILLKLQQSPTKAHCSRQVFNHYLTEKKKPNSSKNIIPFFLWRNSMLGFSIIISVLFLVSMLQKGQQNLPNLTFVKNGNSKCLMFQNSFDMVLT